MKQFLIAYIEDNDLGVYNKEILVEGEHIKKCFKEQIEKYPTLHSIQEIHGKLEGNWEKYYTHESQDILRRSQLKMQKELINV